MRSLFAAAEAYIRSHELHLLLLLLLRKKFVSLRRRRRRGRRPFSCCSSSSSFIRQNCALPPPPRYSGGGGGNLRLSSFPPLLPGGDVKLAPSPPPPLLRSLLGMTTTKEEKRRGIRLSRLVPPRTRLGVPLLVAEEAALRNGRSSSSSSSPQKKGRKGVDELGFGGWEGERCVIHLLQHSTARRRIATDRGRRGQVFGGLLVGGGRGGKGSNSLRNTDKGGKETSLPRGGGGRSGSWRALR